SATKPPPYITACPRVMPNLSHNPEIYVSMLETSYVIPASTNDKKNNTTKNSLKDGNSLIIARNTTKDNPTLQATTSSIPTPSCVAINPITANTLIPANNSNPELLNPVINALFVISDFFGK